ncbi:SgrR family transcriptional regulator [Brevibacillus fortis]|uniref:SgrR family transcriptional regulator n=1 Tax=Brevibacillus fortis TaxID=2126352 RepID=A0A2P7VNC9_9BACL|nr:SgrR family transcriptional regulator [Brevibacillus fortis]PSK00718.1 SgrR family transcriptional regulator [Brevibacillus fortis]
MKSNEHFMQMLLGLSEWEKGREQKISIQELSQLLCCTPRNVKLILRKWESEGLLLWKAGVGRGNHSTLTILCDITDFLTSYFQKLLMDGNVREAVELLHHKNLPVGAKRLLQETWDSQFGFIAEENDKRRQEILRIPRERAFSTIDPAFVAVAAESHFIQQICHTLVIFDLATQDFKPQLAYAWESNMDRSAWTFYLRKGVRFHHGRVLTGEDVAYTVQRLIELDSPYRWQVDDIDWIEQRNDGAITFHLHKPNGFFLHLVSCIGMSILPHDVPFSESAIVGTGPFRMIEFTEDRLVLAAFDDYYRERAILDRVEIWRVPGSSASKQRYQLSLAEDEATEEDSKSLEVQEVGCHYVNFNFRKPGIQHDFDFRQAIKLLIDPVQMIRDLKKETFTPAGSFLPERSQRMQFAAHTIEESAEWLKKSAYQGEPVFLCFSDVKKVREEAEWFQRRCQQIGIRLELKPITKDQFFSCYAEHHAEMAMMGEVLQRDIEMGLIEIYKNKCSMIHRFLDDDRLAIVEERMSEILQLQGSRDRMRALEKMEDTLRDEAWLLFLYHTKRIDHYHPALQGIAVDSFGWIDFSKLWVKSFVTSL